MFNLCFELKLFIIERYSKENPCYFKQRHLTCRGDSCGRNFTSPIEIKLKLTKEMFTYRYVEFSTFC